MKKILIFVFICFICYCPSCVRSTSQISIVADPEVGQVAVYGLEKLTETLQAMNIPFERVNSLANANGKNLLVVGLSEGNGEAAMLLKAGNHTIPNVSEAVTVWNTRWQKKSVTVISGYDDRGIMYGLLDVAQRISWSNVSKPLKYVKDVTSEPYIKERVLGWYVMHRRIWESRFHDENFLTDYFDMMAGNRLNMLEIMFGYENGGFMAPCYPYFFDVEGFPEVTMEITPEQQKRNTEAMRRLIDIAHERGIAVRLGLLDHLYRGRVQAGGNPDLEYDPNRPLPWEVRGLELTGNLIPYTKAAFVKLLKTFPNVDAILYHSNNETGLRNDDLQDFGRSFLETMAEMAPDKPLDIHLKGLTDTLLSIGHNLGLKISIQPKFWLEQMGLPFSPTHLNLPNQKDRRHSYGNTLRYPQKYQVTWKLWNGGTTRVFLWGDPEYVRRFAENTRIYNSSAYVVHEPMATKMEAYWHDMEPFDLLNPQYKYYDQEYERYWYFYKVWGLVGYDPNGSADVLDKEFERRFGVKVAPIIQEAINESSWVLPRIVAACYNYRFSPTTTAWPEKMRLGDLPIYAASEGSDLQQFACFDEEAQTLLGTLETGKTLPSTTSLWLQKLSESIDKKVAEAERKMKTKDNKEFNSTIVDLKMLSRLALYHSRRVPAAVSYCLFQRTQDVKALDAAIAHEQNAIQAWSELVEYAGDVYADNLMMGKREGLSGHWKDELLLLQREFERLKERRANFKPEGTVVQAPLYQSAPAIDNSGYFKIVHKPIKTSPAGQPITIKITVSAPAGIKWIRLQYRAVNQYLDFTTLPMDAADEPNTFQATIPADMIDTKYDLMYLIEMMDNQERGFIYPDLNKETPYVVVEFVRS